MNRYEKIIQTESNFFATQGGGTYTLKEFSMQVPNEDLLLKAITCKPKTRSGFFNPAEAGINKERIVLHYTTGNIQSDLATLTKNTTNGKPVSVPFVIARDGRIYQLFSSNDWAGHLGPGLGNQVGMNNAQDKRTIGIELSNYGYLVEQGSNLETYYSRLKNEDGSINPIDVYCPKSQTEAYQKIATPFREQVYFATYTEAQYESLTILLRFLTNKFNIPRQFLPESERFITTPNVLTFKGIVSHINYRSSGKWDIGTAFDWQKVIEGISAPTFIPELVATKGIMKTVSKEKVLKNDKELDKFWAKSSKIKPVEHTKDANYNPIAFDKRKKI